MKINLLATLTLLLTSNIVFAETVDLAALRSLELVFERAAAVDVYPAQPVAGKVTVRKGEAFSVLSPGRVQQIEYLVEPGATVAKGQPFAVLRGPEMHHLQMNYDSSQALAAGAELRYKRNKPLHERKAISESQWMDISKNYYELALEYEHMRHFFELVSVNDNDHTTLTLVAPEASVIDYHVSDDGVHEGDSIALFIAPEAIRLELALPSRIATRVAAIRAGNCQLDIERVSRMTDGFFLQTWTQSIMPSCDLLLGQQVLALPLVSADNAYRVAKWSVFQLERQNFVWVRRGDSLTTQAVELLGAEDDVYIVQSDNTLNNAEILTSSVSAVQGILLGLGEE